MYLLNDLEHHVFEIPYQNGYRKIRILSGYASSAFLTHILTRYPKIEIDLIVGMAIKDGIRRWDHEQYTQISTENSRITISYQMEYPAIHTKVYYWYDEHLRTSTAFIGSSNFSWNGFRDQNELLGEVNYSNIEEVFNISQTINCNDPNVEDRINFYNLKTRRAKTETGTQELQLDMEIINENSEETERLTNLEYVDLSLLLANDTEIHERSGLNWGQREGREPNQAYIPVPTPFNRENPEFFPPLEESFTMLTDDEQQLVCKMAQQNRKAIHTTENNSIMGRYFRERLGVPLGERVDVQDVLNYGRTSVRVYKIDSATYFMDFGTDPYVTEVW